MTPLGAKVHVGVVAFALNVTHTDPNGVERSREKRRERREWREVERRGEREGEGRGGERREEKRKGERTGEESRVEQSRAVQKRGSKLIKLDFKFRRK